MYSSLYTLEGFLVTNAADLENGALYVAVGTEYGGFKMGNYGAVRPAFQVPGRLERR